MNILISGSTGLIGSALVTRLQRDGHTVTRLTRKKKGTSEPELEYDVDAGRPAPSAFEKFDAIIHLAGENIAAGRWTDEQKRKIRDSRVKSTSFICESIASLDTPPKIHLNASAFGYYGSQGDNIVDEDTPPGNDFLADVCKEWEAATEPAKAKGIRVVNLRFGTVISDEGGALEKMLTPFKLGLGGPVGSGDQWMGWVCLEDAVRAIEFALATESLSGPVNIVAPHPVTNREFTKTLGKVLVRPTIFKVPAFALKAALGEMGEELLLASIRAVPTRLHEAGFKFHCPDLETCLRDTLKK